MGFEQLAALKAQLAKQAQAQATPRKSKPGAASATPAKQSRSKPDAEAATRAKRGKSQPGAASATPATQATPAQPGKPVDPVVRVIGLLQRRFPKAFPKNPAPKLPLKVGIFEDALAQVGELGITEAELRDAIRTWCKGTRYWDCMVTGVPRVDLTGQAAGEVSEADAKRAQRLKANRAARGAAARAPKPE